MIEHFHLYCYTKNEHLVPEIMYVTSKWQKPFQHIMPDLLMEVLDVRTCICTCHWLMCSIVSWASTLCKKTGLPCSYVQLVIVYMHHTHMYMCVYMHMHINTHTRAYIHKHTLYPTQGLHTIPHSYIHQINTSASQYIMMIALKHDIIHF